MRNPKVLKLTQLAMLSAVSIILVLLIHFPIFPAVAFLEYDMADVPVIFGTFLLGPLEGLAVLLVTSIIQAFLLGGNGWVGLVMHFCASGALVLIAGYIYKYKKTAISMIVGLILGSLAWTALMIPLNLTLTVYFMGVPMETVQDLMVPYIIPFNLIKSFANSTLSFILFTISGKYLKKWTLAV